MSSTSPSPNSPSFGSTPPPSSTNSTNAPPPSTPSGAPPPQNLSPPPPSSDSAPPLNSSPPQPSSPPPSITNPLPSVPSPPPQTPSPVTSSPPSPAPPPVRPSPPPPQPDVSPSSPLSPPPPNSPVPPSSKPPQKSPPPPPQSNPPINPPPPPPPSSPSSSTPEESPSPPPPQSKPPINSPSPPPPQSKSPPQSKPPKNSPPPPRSPTSPSSSSPPPPPSNPPKSPPVSTSSNAPPPPPPHLTPSPTRPASQPVSLPPSLLAPPSISLPSSPSISPPSNNSTPSPSPPITSNSRGIGTTGAVTIGVISGFSVLGLVAFLIWYCCLRKKHSRYGLNNGHIMPSTVGSSPTSDSSFRKANSSAPMLGTGSISSSGGLGNSRPLFTYNDLVKATDGFSAQNLLGQGGFGSVYKGHLPDDRVVAVKQLKIGGSQGEREFKAEVETISRIHHRHLVSLIGYCISDNQRLLVYEYVPNNTLYFHLHGKDRPVLDWPRRVKIAAGAARGIAYLHEDCHPRIIHRDIKSSNILLDENFEARVSDFGLAKIALDMYTHITTRVMGTFGYMAPEYASSGKLTDKSDVFSFGVVLLELITGRKPVDTSQPLGDESLVEWARPLLSDAIETESFGCLVDPRLEGNYVESEMFSMIEAAAACVRHSAAKRPRMSQVMRAFDNVAGSDLSNGMKPGQSEVFDSAQQSSEIRFFRRMAFGSHNYSTDFFSANV